ncbi:MAG TPA: o-succinylbenzoate synthase [Candidatus Fraserbacteria bacterium]|nr:o-succinylbenzoate synthase [Candidatus Fraserbacteria bacterium]
MKLESISLREIELSLLRPFETSFGRQQRRRALIISVQAEGLRGWGECVAGSDPWYSYETTRTAWQIIADYLIPALAGLSLEHPDEAWPSWARVRGHPMAKAGLEQALWDLYAKSQDISLARALGGDKTEIESGISIGIQSDIPITLKLIEESLSQGYRRIKLKIKPGWDVQLLAAVRTDFPKIRLTADANAAYTLADAARLKELDRFDLLMLEQPLGYDDLLDHADLQRRLKTPICLDESIKSPADACRALELGSCRIINIKSGRVGGLSQAKAIHDLCRAQDIPVWCGGMLETGIGRAHNLALASLPGFSLPNDISASERYYLPELELVEPPFELDTNGTISVPDGPGLGVRVLEERLERVTLKRQEWQL